MKVKNFKDIKVGSKVKYEGFEWLFVGVQKEFGRIARIGDDTLKTDFLYAHELEKLEILEVPTYDYPQRFKPTDYVYLLEGNHGIVLSERNKEHQYLVFVIEEKNNVCIHEDELYDSQEALDAEIKRNTSFDDELLPEEEKAKEDGETNE